MSSQSSKPLITPSDPSWRYHCWGLTALLTILSQFLWSSPPRSFIEHLRNATVLIGTACTFALLHGRNITLQQACALRLSHPKDSFKKAMKNKTILTSTGMKTIFQLLSTTSIMSVLPEIYYRLMGGQVSGIVGKVDAPVGWFFGVVNVTIVVVCWVMILTQDEMTFDFDGKVKPDEIPLQALELSEKGDEWKRVAGTSRRHDVYVRPTTPGSTHEMMTRLATNHPLYNPEKDAEPSGAILHITL